MKILYTLTFLLFYGFAGFAQLPTANQVQGRMPKGTVIHGNIPYNGDTLKKHLLDIYLPANTKGKVPSGGVPLVVFIHGGGWLVNDKYSDMGYMPNTIAAMLDNGMAVVSIDYRFASQAVFPALIQDCNKAVEFLVNNADKYGFDKSRVALMGFSAGGHLASLQGLADNNKVFDFYMDKKPKTFAFRAVVDFYGPSDLASLGSSDDPKAPEAILIGAVPVARPDLAKAASPVSYVDKNDPPFLIIHGEKDNLVSPKQSKLLGGWLNVVGVPNELIIVKDAPHFGIMFDTDEVRAKVMAFLKKNLID